MRSLGRSFFRDELRQPPEPLRFRDDVFLHDRQSPLDGDATLPPTAGGAKLLAAPVMKFPKIRVSMFCVFFHSNVTAALNKRDMPLEGTGFSVRQAHF